MQHDLLEDPPESNFDSFPPCPRVQGRKTAPQGLQVVLMLGCIKP